MFLGNFPEDFTTVTCMFTTHQANGAPVAPNSAFEADDVKIYKNGDAAQKTTTNGVTMTSPFDSITGLHCVVIDTSNDTGDSGFWTSASTYTLVLSPDETVDGVAVAKVIGTFTLEVNTVVLEGIPNDVVTSTIEGLYTFRDLMRLMSAAILGKASGLDTGSPVFRDVNDTTDRVIGTTDADGNRSAVTLDAT